MENRVHHQLSGKYSRYCIDYHPIVLIDWKDITGENLKIYDTHIVTHPETRERINGVIINNECNIRVNVDAFLENALCYSKRRRSKQCECIVYPVNAKMEEWILFIETKYANNFVAAFDSRNNYPNYAITQIKETVNFCREKSIIAPDKIVHAMVSFPNLCEQFSAFVFPETETILDILQTDGIIIRATNLANIKDDLHIELLAD